MQIYLRGHLLTKTQTSIITPVLMSAADGAGDEQLDNLLELALIEAGCPIPPTPSETGVGEYCAPGPADSQVPAFILRFEDQDRPDIVIFDRAQAFGSFSRAESLGWNCHLFERVKRQPLA